ncbi:MMPL family transporter [Nocardioides dongxiaopingii]|uniref:MMPL family transporter n=1 Tax=Nocardioides sp. S-1144 TaxID=2582905 RepID=UPI00110F26FE|nr:MMPL family transporter [Nocardioides sp. S-1144]QCW49694.1 MMPL family transporter [Nocardioides sp. S-1144]
MDTTTPPRPDASPGRTRSRLTRLLHTHPRRSLLAVLLFLVVAGVLGGPVAGTLDSDGGFAPADSDSALAVERLEEASGRSPSAGIVALVDTGTPTGTPDDVEAAARTLAGLDGVAEALPAGASRDGTSALVVAVLDATADEEAVAEAALAAFEDDDAVTLGGPAVTGLQIGERVGEDLGRAELLAFPVLVLLSLLFFGGRAAVLPLVVGATTVLGTFLALAGVNQVYGLSVFALNLVIGLGLGLAIDYTLFLLSRYREELDRQGPGLGAVLTTMRTAGRTVVYSAATVAVALATLTVFPMGFLKSMGLAGAVVAVVAAAAALVVSPAIFGLWGPKLARRRRGAAAGSSEGRWYRLSHAVMARPGAVAAVTAVVMVVLAAPALRAEWTPVDSSAVPTDLSARTVADTLENEYDGAGTTPVLAAVRADGADEAASFAGAASQLPGVLTPAEAVEVGPGTWQVDLTVDGDPEGDAAQRVVAEVRGLAGDTGTDVLVGGPAAEFVDQQAAIGDALPLAAGLLVLLTVLVLWLMTGSVVLPVKAVVMNTLTAGVALGALTFVYQDGRLTGLLGYTPNGGVEPTNFLVAAAVVFALSTDYGVFLLGRIKEARESGLTEREAVATGLGRTGSVVTAAAILLAVAIGAFSTSSISFIQQIGMATAVGVLVDAFVVRSFLVPALMGLLGKWNWWSPMPLRRLHDRIGLSEGEPVPVELVRVLAGTP